LKNVSALVWGGLIQEFVFSPGKSEAEVLFVNPADCKKYFDATPNGIQYPGQPDLYITVKACPAESARGNVKEIMEKAMSRCVRVMDVDQDWTRLALSRIAAGVGSKNPRAVDNIVSGKTPQGVSANLSCCVYVALCCNFKNVHTLTNSDIQRRVADFRFSKVADAVIFKAELSKDPEWQKCPIGFGEDPCAKHNAVHAGKM
jgi:hypothetical protein